MENSKRNQFRTIMLMSMPVAIHSVIAVMAMPKAISKRAARANDILNVCVENEYVPMDDAEKERIIRCIKEYEDSKAKGRPDKWRLLNDALTELMKRYQNIANKQPGSAITIIQSGGFKIKKVSIPQKHVFGASNDGISGRIDLKAMGGGSYTCHDWHYSADGIKWERLVPTIAAETFIDDLIEGEYAYFKHQLINKRGETGYDNVIKIMVQ